MKTIWKFDVAVNDGFSVDMPLGSRVICVQVQRSSPVMWALVDTAEPLRSRRFRVYGTGNPADGATVAGYVGTFQTGALVWHLFEVLS